MKKRLSILLILLLIVSTGLFAGIFNLSVGATAQFKIPAKGVDATEFMGDIENWAFGPDVRLRLLFAEVGVTGLYSPREGGGHILSGLVTGGVSFDVLGMLRVGLGMGPRVAASFDKDFGNATIMVDGAPEGSDFGKAFMNAPMTYRATVDFKLSKFLIGLNYTIDSDGFTFENAEVGSLLPNFKDNPGKIGVSLLYSFF
ncbi:MAG: hypothetical protein ACOXZZ_03885 [Sphaerochaetaceae bacterium]|jgi:hypothetical protein